MNLIQLKCPNCNADLEIEDELDTCFCKYCGTKIRMPETNRAMIRAKTKLKMADKKLELRKEEHRQHMEWEKKHGYDLHFLLIGLMLFYLLLSYLKAQGIIS